jgi:hypothetical protein
MTIAYAALHRPLVYRGEDTRLYGLAFEDGQTFVSRRQPSLYDRHAQPVLLREVLPGSKVNVSFIVEEGIKRMLAVQLVSEATEQVPFDPIPDDGHL